MRIISKIKKIGDSYIITIPRKERLELDLDVGSLVIVDLTKLSEEYLNRITALEQLDSQDSDK